MSLDYRHLYSIVGDLLRNNGGTTRSNNNIFVLIRMQDFAVLEHYYKYAEWRDTTNEKRRPKTKP